MTKTPIKKIDISITELTDGTVAPSVSFTRWNKGMTNFRSKSFLKPTIDSLRRAEKKVWELTMSQMSERYLKYEDQWWRDYKIDREQWLEIEQAMEDEYNQSSSINPTVLAENTAIAVGHDEWLDDETHPIWELALIFYPEGDLVEIEDEMEEEEALSEFDDVTEFDDPICARCGLPYSKHPDDRCPGFVEEVDDEIRDVQE